MSMGYERARNPHDKARTFDKLKKKGSKKNTGGAGAQPHAASSVAPRSRAAPPVMDDCREIDNREERKSSRVWISVCLR